MAIGDVSTGLAAAMAVGFALLHRERTGEGQYIDCSILDTYFNMHETNIPRVTMANSPYHPQRTGSQWPDGGPAGIFRCGDGRFIAMMVLPHQWHQIVEALDMPELATDPRFKTPRLRRDNNDAMKDIMEGWLARFQTRDEAIKALELHRVPVAPVITLREAVAHPHLRQRNTVRTVQDRLLGEFAIPGMPAKFSGFPEQTSGLRASMLGEDNESVLREIGLSEAEIAELYREKVLVRDPMMDSGEASSPNRAAKAPAVA
jgi:crotonobetainyl-CoA:carnitine CoA-transferase CaiB-like acyl-CoA transferase